MLSITAEPIILKLCFNVPAEICNHFSRVIIPFHVIQDCVLLVHVKPVDRSDRAITFKMQVQTPEVDSCIHLDVK